MISYSIKKKSKPLQEIIPIGRGPRPPMQQHPRQTLLDVVKQQLGIRTAAANEAEARANMWKMGKVDFIKFVEQTKPQYPKGTLITFAHMPVNVPNQVPVYFEVKDHMELWYECTMDRETNEPEILLLMNKINNTFLRRSPKSIRLLTVEELESVKLLNQKTTGIQ